MVLTLFCTVVVVYSTHCVNHVMTTRLCTLETHFPISVYTVIYFSIIFSDFCVYSNIFLSIVCSYSVNVVFLFFFIM